MSILYICISVKMDLGMMKNCVSFRIGNLMGYLEKMDEILSNYWVVTCLRIAGKS